MPSCLVTPRRALLVCLLGAGMKLGAADAAKDSPFLPSGSAAAPAATAAAAAEYELIGMSVVGKNTLLSILRQSDKRSVWVAVGKSVSEVHAVGYDPERDEATIRVDGKNFTLPMRKSAVVTGPAAQVPPPAPLVMNTSAPNPPVEPARPMTQNEEKETEARMLVTDLLEIGQQQRKAYEEARRQADQKKAESTPPAPAAAVAQKTK